MLGCAARNGPQGQSPVDFSYQMGGNSYNISQLRGKPLLIVLIRTSEVTSDLYLREVVRAFHVLGPKARFLVLTIAPNEELMLTPYAEFNELPFSIGMADWSVATGQSHLGLIPIIPSTYLLDPDGVVVDMAAGVTSWERIVEAVEKYSR